jgi:eukaryotic-like serine/threonine-protein kinase
VDIALPVLAGVAAAHEEGIVHCDLKASNIFLARMRDGAIHPKVLDFGISRAIADLGPASGEGRLFGSPGYLAPEQLRDADAVSPAGDQYALGIMLHECLTGSLPFAGSTLDEIFGQILSGEHVPAARFRPDLPPGLQAVIARAMSLDPAARFPDLTAMGRALLPFSSPATRITWERSFGKPGLGAAPVRDPGRAWPVPVTDQTPGSSRPAARVTMAIRGTEWLPPSSPAPVPAVLEPEVPEPPAPIASALPRSRGPWVVACLVVIVCGGLTFMAVRRAGALPQAAQPARAAPRVAEKPLLEQRPVRAQAVVAPPEPAAPPAATPRPTAPRRARPAVARPRTVQEVRFGRNGAPLID